MKLKNKKLNLKAFSLIELLGVIVIIGILSAITIVSVSKYFNKSREQKDEQNKNDIIMAAEMFYQANRDLLPKGIGESGEVDLVTLKKAKYLKSDVVNSRNESCMKDSYVRVVKMDDDYYSYLANLYCGDEEPAGISDTIPSPVVLDFKFTDKNTDTTMTLDKDEKFTDIKNARFTFTIKGSQYNKKIGIYSYNYSILVKDASVGDEYTEVFNSGAIKGGSKHSIDVKSQPLANYIDLTGEVSVKVRIYVMNDQGMYINYSSDTDSNSGSNSYEDTVAPECGEISGNAYSDDEWTNKSTYVSGSTTTGRTRGYPSVLTVQCNDGDGSGCKRVDFSKSWPTKAKNELGIIDYSYGARWAYVVLEDNSVNVNNKENCSKTLSKSSLRSDNSVNICNKYKEKDETIQNGNQRVCFVRVNVDVKAPTVDVKVYKAGTNEEVARMKIEDKAPINNKTNEDIIRTEDIEGSVGVEEKEQWLNLENFPNGIELSAEVSDNLYLYRWTWETSDGYRQFSTADSDLVASASVQNAMADGTKVAEGYFESTVDDEIVTNISEFEKNEHGALKGSISGLKLKLEGKRYGKLTVYDKAGNPTILHIYANIDRTPPLVPDMSHTKIGAKTDEVNYPASNEAYEPANKNNFTDNEHWSREKISTFVEGQREDKMATDERFSDTTLEGNLSGWWKFTYVYEMQDPNKKKYSWLKAVEKDAVETISFEDEGTHKVRIRSCDKAKNCSIYSPDDYLKIDYTLPKCDIKETFTNTTGYNENGWLKKNETVLLSHICDDPKSNISSNCNPNSKFNQQTYLYNFDVETDKAGANGFINPINNVSIIDREDFDEWYAPSEPTAGGHVVDYAGNIVECGVKTVKIDYVTPSCFTKITYGVDGKENSSVKPKNPSNETGWLSLYKGGIDQKISSAQKETATVSHDCDDPKSESGPMLGVHSKCDTKTYKHTVYNWELRTTIAGALGLGQGGEIADLAGNIAQCPADRTINIDYTQPKCNTVIEYPQGGPINQTEVDVESGWLGYNDNKNCNKTPSSSSSGVTVSGSTNMTNTAVSSNIKGEGNVRVVTHNAYLSSISAYNTVTRAEFAKILCDALDVKPVSTYTNMFKDVTESTPNWKYILAASQQGFFIGIGDHQFSPNTKLKRAELVSAIIRAAAARGVTSSKSCSVSFADISDDAWYADDVRSASNNCFFYGVGAAEGQPSSFYSAPNNDATIAEIATVIYRTFRKEDEVSCKTTDNKEFNANGPSSYPSWASAALMDATTNHTCTNGVEASGIVGADGTKTFNAYIDASSYNYNGNMLRQEFLKILYDAAQVTPTNQFKSTFSDVTTSNAYWRYIIDAANHGYVNGVGGGKFAPNTPITRAEMITSLVRIMEDNGLSTGKTCSTNIPDLAKGQWYSSYMEKAAGMCLLVGDDNGMYRATEPATNMEAITVIYRAFRDHEGLKCTTASGEDYDKVMVYIPDASGSGNVPTNFWGYEYLKDAALSHTCSGSLVDPNSTTPLKGEIPDTSCNQISTEKKTAVITQICTELSEFNSSTGQTGVTSGCYGSMADKNSSIVNEFQSATYNKEIITDKGGAVGDGNNGYIVDVAGNITNCNTPDNWHTVKIDYSRPTCLVTTKFVDRRLGKSGDYSDAHWMGKNSSATISSFCDRVNDKGGSGCWEEKNTTLTYSKEIKAVNVASSVPNFGDAFVYDLAGNRSQSACDKKTVKIDTTGPSCDDYARYQKTKDPIGASSELTADYSSEYYMVPNWEKGWLDGDYTVRVISYCQKDVMTNVHGTGNMVGSGCKGMPFETDPTDKKNQRSYVDYRAANNTVINGPKGARPAKGTTNDSEDFYEHKAYSVGSGSTITRKQFAESLLKALDISPAAASHPFKDVSASDPIIGAIFSNNLMIGTSTTIFNPDKAITRAEMIVAVVRAAQQLGISYPKTCSGNFSDYTLGSGAWYSSEVDYAIKNCILVGFENNTLRPTENATAQQAYTVIDRALRVHDEDYVCTPALTGRNGSSWHAAGDWESTTYHKCVRTEKSNTEGSIHVIYDNVGNKSECGEVLVQLDNKNPTCTTESNHPEWVNGSTTVTVSSKCNDENGAGCRKEENGSKVDNGTVMGSKEYNKVSGGLVNMNNAGSKKQGESVTIYDGVQHKVVCPANASVKIDDEPPKCTITKTGTFDRWSKGGATVTGNCDDKSGSGCAESSKSLGSYSEYYDHKLLNQYYSYTAKDKVGNTKDCTPETHNVLLDNHAPTFSCSWSPSYNSNSDYDTSSISYPTYPEDNYSGVKTITPDKPSSFSCSSSGTKTATVKVCDDVGNCDEQTCGSITIPGCCSEGNVGEWTDVTTCEWQDTCGCGKTIYSKKKQKKYSKLDGSECDEQPYTCDSMLCPPCSTSTGFIFNSMR